MPFDKTAYQREYMRQRRAAQRAAKPVRQEAGAAFKDALQRIYEHILQHPGQTALEVSRQFLDVNVDTFIEVIQTLQRAGRVRCEPGSLRLILSEKAC